MLLLLELLLRFNGYFNFKRGNRGMNPYILGCLFAVEPFTIIVYYYSVENLNFIVHNFNTEVKTDTMLVDKWDSARSGRTEL